MKIRAFLVTAFCGVAASVFNADAKAQIVTPVQGPAIGAPRPPTVSATGGLSGSLSAPPTISPPLGPTIAGSMATPVSPPSRVFQCPGDPRCIALEDVPDVERMFKCPGDAS